MKMRGLCDIDDVSGVPSTGNVSLRLSMGMGGSGSSAAMLLACE